ncbi:gliding motility protein [Candidatus Magnetomorum sp. HK-1]|nr:gliding motility protein [Candidatus Magnetomorum sp. HK-1]
MSFDRSKFMQRYIDDAFENVSSLNKGLLKLEKSYDESILNDLFRTAHTLKGTSRMMKQLAIAQVSHQMEDIFDIFRKNKDAASSDIIDQLLNALDAISNLLKAIANGESTQVPEDICNALENIVQSNAQKSHKNKVQTVHIVEKKAEKDRNDENKSTLSPPTEKNSTPYTSETIRIHVNKLDQVIKLIDGIVSTHSRLKQRLSDIQNIEHQYQLLLNQFSRKWSNENTSISSNIFSHVFPKALDIKNKLKEMRTEIREDVNIQELLTSEFQEHSLKMRMMPLSTLFDTLHLTVRDMAKQFEKKIDFIVQGGETELDKKIIERIEAPLLHMIRNSIDHGIELPDVRKQNGKQETGVIHLSAKYESGNVLIRIIDDGYGIQLQKVKEKALKRKLISESDLKIMTENQIINMIFIPGFSTSEIVTDISGRGVGLDVVKQSILKTLKGNVQVYNNSKAGCTFEVRLPLTMAMMHLLTVKIKNTTFAIPSGSVDEIIRMPSSEIIQVAHKDAIQIRDALIPIVNLKDVLRMASTDILTSLIPLHLIIVVVKSGDEKLGLIVDELIDEEVLVIKPLPDHLKNNQWVSGIVISGKNEIINVLHIPKLLEEASNNLSPKIIQGTQQETTSYHILVVDDSLSTREIEKSILESYGYKVSIASDGSQAYDMAKNNHFDLILTDVEMPKMNGFELTQNLRKNAQYAETPIILLTSLDHPEDKKRGIKSGANAYIVKGDFDQSSLIDVIENLIVK